MHELQHAFHLHEQTRTPPASRRPSPPCRASVCGVHVLHRSVVAPSPRVVTSLSSSRSVVSCVVSIVSFALRTLRLVRVSSSTSMSSADRTVHHRRLLPLRSLSRSHSFLASLYHFRDCAHALCPRYPPRDVLARSLDGSFERFAAPSPSPPLRAPLRVSRSIVRLPMRSTLFARCECLISIVTMT